MLQSESIQPSFLPHDAFKAPIHLVALLFHSPHHPPTLSTTSVTAALRPGRQEQLVCLPALLTTANLWLEGTLTSLPTTWLHIKPLTLPSSRFLPYSQDATLQ